MVFSVKFKKSDLVGGIILKGANWYPLKVTDCEVKLSKASNLPTLYWTFELLSNSVMPEAEGAKLWDQKSLQPKARFSLAAPFKAFGIEIPEDQDLDIDEKAFVDQEIDAYVETDTDDKGKPVNKITDYAPAGTQAKRN